MLSIRTALVGNPNAGKTSLFNALTGFHQHVGNWPGKTVTKKSGQCHFNGIQLELVDLPGTYSLSPFSNEEMITRDYLLTQRPSVVMCVVDAANLERNLFLTVQILELGLPVVVALNMMDMAHARGLKVDINKLSRRLGAPVIATVASRKQGMEPLLEAVVATAFVRQGADDGDV